MERVHYQQSNSKQNEVSLLTIVPSGSEKESIPRSGNKPETQISFNDGSHIFREDILPDFSEEINNIDRLRDLFDSQLHTDTSNTLLSWDPVKSRNRFEQCQTRTEKEAWRINEVEEITTSLRERYNCLENPMDLFIDRDGFFRNKKFPSDTLETILRRGVAYQETHGSKELERERSEVEGILKVQADFTSPSAQDGDIRIIFSPPGSVDGSPYTKHFVDTYGLSIDSETGERRVDAKRYAVNMSTEEYIKAATILEPSYFADKNGPLDAIFLGNPIQLDGIGDIDGLLDQILLFDSDALRGYEFAVIDKILEPIKPLLVQAIVAFNPELIAEILNTVFHIGDEAERHVKTGAIDMIKDMLAWSNSLTKKDIESEIAVRGYAPIQRRQVGCGDSGSFVNSVGQFGVIESDQYGSLKFECPTCKQTNTRPRGTLIPNCKHCLADVSCNDESIKSEQNKKKVEQEKKKAGEEKSKRNEKGKKQEKEKRK